MAQSAPTVRPQDIIRRIGDTNEKALRYVLEPDPQLSRLSRKLRENLITDLPPVTAGALLGPAALARHFIASAATGRYRDLFALWQLFIARPAECKPVLAERPAALAKGQQALVRASQLGLMGRAERVAADVTDAEGLIWQWLREVLMENPAAVGARPAVASALLHKEPDAAIPLPEEPSERWLAEAAATRQEGPLPPPIEAMLASHVDRLPATVGTLAMAHASYPERVEALIDRVDLGSPEIGAVMAWARDHGHGDRLHERIAHDVEETTARDRAAGLTRWYAWRERGVDLALPGPLRSHSVEGLDLTRPESGVLISLLVADGAAIDPQAQLDEIAATNRQLAEKAFESFVCAGLDVTLPAALQGNPIVKDGTRCAFCQAWTWVRPGHERRCPRRPADGAPQPAVSEPEAGEAPGWQVPDAPADAPANAAADVPDAPTGDGAPGWEVPDTPTDAPADAPTGDGAPGWEVPDTPAPAPQPPAADAPAPGTAAGGA
ncbi:MAG: hypothetical protein WD080_08175 [Egibacteraceae bacterium]